MADKYITLDNLSLFKDRLDDVYIVQYASMPAASSHSGEIAQYTGTTDATYTNGYFYKSNGTAWSQINIQPAPPSGMTNPMTTQGDIIYASDNTGTPARLAKGSAGKVLKATANGIEWADLTNVFSYIGITTTTISDGSTTQTIMINGSSVTVTNGNVAAYNNVEYVWTGSMWEELGNENAATASVLGNVKLGSDTTQTVAAASVSATADRTYAIQTNSSGQLVVNVPWVGSEVVNGVVYEEL